MKKQEEKKEKVLKWKLSEKPTADNISRLVSQGILNKEEARSIILDESELSSKDLKNIDDLMKEVELLRKLFLESSRDNIKVIKIIEKEIDRATSYPNYWTYPYTVWCSSVSSGTSTSLENQAGNTFIA